MQIAAAAAKLELYATAESLRTASLWLADWCASHAVTDDAAFRLDICLNEALANVMEHGGETACVGVRLELAAHPGHPLNAARLQISDAGPAFDPLAASDPASAISLADAAPGGLGLHMIKQFAHEFRYRYRDQRNELQVTVHWPDDSAQA